MNFNESELNNLTKKELINIITKQKKTLESQENFFLNISHDLRSPINNILSVLQCLKYINDFNDEEANRKRNEYRNIIRRNSLKIIKLIDNLIDTTKLEGNNYKLSKININIVSVVENIVECIRSYAQQKKINLIFNTNVKEFIINADPQAIDRIVMNLLSNAIKFSPINSKILVDIKVIDNIVNISVKDEGIGIDEKDRKKIFNRFEQASSSKRIEGKGSGIGLDLVNYLVSKHNGSINLRSEVNHGSEFIVSLPIGNINNCDEVSYLPTKEKVEQLEIEFSDIYL